ncbi:MAG TPA: pyrimidine/purine nucleoside phosphorylase [Candidatus Cloacimonadota bacterium]|nr:pyrimidine/purine nucleoside phosphorylase [Candidatus Cloacimonadota bacterium]HPS38485.1 pyrimidine/purine nucleoside phosphorylase [Candidatus Cloacimonadota bacterium]
MLKSNSYFNEQVKSIALENGEGTSTVGVMDLGEYEFGTSTIEYMTVISGALTVLLPDQTEWKTYGKGETFIVDKDKKFKLIVKEQTAYHCLYK